MNNPDSTAPESPNNKARQSGKQDSAMRALSLGQIVATANAISELPNAEMLQALARHCAGDWGDVCEDDRQANEYALANGERILSVYYTETGIKFWIITEWDRSITTILLPDDY